MTVQNQYSATYCPFNYADPVAFPEGRPPVIRLKDFNCASDPIGPAPVPDRVCWQKALYCAFDPTPGSFKLGAVEATGGVTYSIDDTLCVIGARGGEIDGHGAHLNWTGPNHEMNPMLYFGSVQFTTLRNLVFSSRPAQPNNPQAPAHTALMFGSLRQSLEPVVSNANHLEDITIDGTDTYGLQYGIRFVGPSSFGAADPLSLADINNDLFEIENSNIFNVDKAGISIEHSQSMQHHLLNVNMIASPGNWNIPSDDVLQLAPQDPPTEPACLQLDADQIMGASGVRVLAGSFDSYGGLVTGFGNAAYFLDAVVAYISIVNLHSEHCGRLLRTQNGYVGYTDIVQISGGRFAVDEVSCDGRIVEWYRPGPLRIDGLQLSRETGEDPIKFFIDPRIINAATAGKAEVDISHVAFFIPGSATWPDIIQLKNPSQTYLVSEGNQCRDDSGVAPCPGLGGGTSQAVAVLKNKDLTDSSNHFPPTLAATDFTSPTNTFPDTGAIGFTKTPGSTTVHCSPHGAMCQPLESKVSLPLPALRATRCDCKASAAPGSTKKWQITLRADGSPIGATCEIADTATSCSVALNATDRWPEGAPVSMKFAAVGTPGSATIVCSVGVRP